MGNPRGDFIWYELLTALECNLECQDAIRHPCLSAPKFVTGVVLPIDGGASIGF